MNKADNEIYDIFEDDWVGMTVITLTKLAVPEIMGNIVGQAELTHAICYNPSVGKIEEYPLRDTFLKTIQNEQNQERINFGPPEEKDRKKSRKHNRSRNNQG